MGEENLEIRFLRGCKQVPPLTLVDPIAQCVGRVQSLLHHVQPCFAPVQPQVAPAQEAFRSIGSKDLLHPLLTTFGDFPIFDPSPRRSGLQTFCRFLTSACERRIFGAWWIRVQSQCVAKTSLGRPHCGTFPDNSLKFPPFYRAWRLTPCVKGMDCPNPLVLWRFLNPVI